MAFASVTDVATRLVRELTATETAQAEQLLDAATAVIAEAAGKDDAWATALELADGIPQMLRFLAVEVTVRSMPNTHGLRSESEQLGQYQRSQSFRDHGGGLELTKTEELLVRRVVHGRTSGSVRVEGVIDEVYDVWYGS